MLKIKDNVDMNIFIEKYDFKPRYCPDTGKLIELYRINGRYFGETKKRRQTTTITMEQNYNRKVPKRNWFSIFVKTKEIHPEFYGLKLDDEDYEILYDLIKADLVEKVEE